MTTYSLGDRVLVRLGAGRAREAEVIEDRGDRVRIVCTDDEGVEPMGHKATVLKSRLSPIPVKALLKRVEPLLPPAKRLAIGEPTQPFASEWGFPVASEPATRAVPKPPPPWRSARYLAYIRGHDICSCCGLYSRHDDPMEASHHGPHGMAVKSDDSRAIPLRRSCHAYYHQHGVFRGYDGDTWTREQTDALAECTAARLLLEYCRAEECMDVDRIVIDALTAALRDK